MSELVQNYVPAWYVSRMQECLINMIITDAFLVIKPDTKDCHLWDKEKKDFMRSENGRDVYTYVSNCCEHPIDCNKAASIFDTIYDALIPDGDKELFKNKNSEKINEFITNVVIWCNEKLILVKHDKSELVPTINSDLRSTPEALAIKAHLDCIDLTLDAIDFAGELKSEQVCVIKDHLKCVEILLVSLAANTFPMLY